MNLRNGTSDPRLQTPEAQAYREQFRNPTGPANPQTAADLAALEAQAARYSNTIRGNAFSSDFSPTGAYGSASPAPRSFPLPETSLARVCVPPASIPRRISAIRSDSAPGGDGEGRQRHHDLDFPSPARWRS